MVVSFCPSTKESNSSHTRERAQTLEYRYLKPDTPTRKMITDNPEFECFYVKPQRQALVEYLGGEVCWAPIDFFFSNILPPINPKFNIENIFEECIVKEELKQSDDSYVWSVFEKDPQDNDQHETAVFEPLGEIYKVITDLVKRTHDKGPYLPIQTTSLNITGNVATWSEKDSDLTPEAHVHLIEPGLGYPKEFHWYNSAFVLEFKKHSNKESEVILNFSS